MTRVCSVPMGRCAGVDDGRWRMGYARRAGASCALLCGSSALIGALTFAAGSAPECLPPTIVLAAVALAGLIVAACPSFACRIVLHVMGNEQMREKR